MIAPGVDPAFDLGLFIVMAWFTVTWIVYVILDYAELLYRRWRA